MLGFREGSAEFALESVCIATRLCQNPLRRGDLSAGVSSAAEWNPQARDDSIAVVVPPDVPFVLGAECENRVAPLISDEPADLRFRTRGLLVSQKE
jgi:hypothetical protein